MEMTADARVVSHNVRAGMLSTIRTLGLIEAYQEPRHGGSAPLTLSDLGRKLAEPEGRRAELTGIAAVTA
jgi:hypothetical protein